MAKTSTLDLYTRFFELSRRPFALVPDPTFLFWSDHHQRAYSMLEYGLLTRAPITLVTGEVGTGKSTLLFHMLDNVGDELQVGLVANARGGEDDLLHWVLQSLGLAPTPDESYVQLFGRLVDYLISEYAKGRRVVLIFDEAQNLTRKALEELRMLTNVNSRVDEILQLVLVGQPELVETIREPCLKQFAQRVASSVHLPAMDGSMVKSYLDHRLSVAGAQTEIFTSAAANTIHGATGGVPRLVNQLADLALVYAYTSEVRQVNASLVQRVIDEGAFFGVRRPDPEDDAERQTPSADREQPVIPTRPLPAMNPRLFRTYLDRRVRTAGGSEGVFTQDAADLICRRTGGNPRLVDQIADLALVYAHAYDVRQVDLPLVQEMFDDGLFRGRRSSEDTEQSPVLTLRPTRAHAE
jgi:type II secretory pathway predicted ATPase ExeA